MELMAPLQIAEMHREILPYLFERWVKKYYVSWQSFKINASAWMKISLKGKLLANLTLALVLICKVGMEDKMRNRFSLKQ